MAEGFALTEATYYILLSLVRPRHGYGIMHFELHNDEAEDWREVKVSICGVMSTPMAVKRTPKMAVMTRAVWTVSALTALLTSSMSRRTPRSLMLWSMA